MNVTFDRPGWSYEILKALHVFHQQEEYCDVVVVCNDKKIRAHSCVLAAASPWVASELQCGSSEGPVQIVSLEDTPSQVVQYIMTFVYTGQFKVPLKHMKEVQALAGRLRIKCMDDDEEEGGEAEDTPQDYEVPVPDSSLPSDTVVTLNTDWNEADSTPSASQSDSKPSVSHSHRPPAASPARHAGPSHSQGSVPTSPPIYSRPVSLKRSVQDPQSDIPGKRKRGRPKKAAATIATPPVTTETHTVQSAASRISDRAAEQSGSDSDNDSLPDNSHHDNSDVESVGGVVKEEEAGPRHTGKTNRPITAIKTESTAAGNESEGSDIEISSDVEDFDPEIGGAVMDRLMNQYDSDGDDESTGSQAVWEQEEFVNRQTKPFTKRGGATTIPPEDAGPAQYFDLFFNDKVWDLLVEQTNKYARQQRAAIPPASASGPKWAPVTRASMRAFMGLAFSMGVIRLPQKHDYWRQSNLTLRTTFREIMSRDNFSQIWRYLHLSDNETADKSHRLWKVQPYIDQLNTSFQSVYTPYGKFSLDQCMVPFKGRMSCRPDMPSKQTKWGIKVWSLAESDTGYMSKIQAYADRDEMEAELSLAHRVVMDLTSQLFFSQAQIYMDGFYTSPDLFVQLANNGVQACGAVRANRRGLPINLLPRNQRSLMVKHQSKVAQKDDLMFAIWQDINPVCVLSNFHTPTDVGYVNRKGRDGRKQRIQTPKALADYHLYMKGVDLADQMNGYYILNHRSKKWWRRIFFYLMMVSAHNAYIVAKDCHPEKVKREWPTFQRFVEGLGSGLIANTRTTRQAPAIPSTLQPGILHEIIQLYKKRKICRECSLGRVKPTDRAGATKFGCVQCQEPVHLTCHFAHVKRHNRSNV